MKTIKSCEFNMDTGCVELRFQDDSMISIDCTAVENEVAVISYERPRLSQVKKLAQHSNSISAICNSTLLLLH